jgi:hypothetical protein
MTSGSIIKSRWILVRLALSFYSSHLAPDKEVVASFQAQFDIVVLTTYLPVTFDKLRSMSEKDVHVTINEEINRVSVAGQDSSPAA